MNMSSVVLLGISKSFDERRVLSNISFEIKSGEFISIVGKYGTGKTTLLKIIAGLLEPDFGLIEINNKTPKKLLIDRKIGFAFQDPALLEWRNVLRNITLPLEIDRIHTFTYANRLLKTVGLESKKNVKPRELSGGMQRIVAILRALVLKPSVLILDEPFSSIDEVNRSDLHEKLIKIHEVNRQTAIMVTHSLEEAVYLSDRIIVLGDSPARIIKIFTVKSPRQKINKYSLNNIRLVNKVRRTILESV
jgi:NitT/TauT family transport system ATP-binding protein